MLDGSPTLNPAIAAGLQDALPLVPWEEGEAADVPMRLAAVSSRSRITDGFRTWVTVELQKGREGILKGETMRGGCARCCEESLPPCLATPFNVLSEVN